MMTVWSLDYWLENKSLKMSLCSYLAEINEANSPVESLLSLAWAFQHSDKEQQESCIKTPLLLAYGTDW